MTIEALYSAVGGDYQATLRRLMVPEIVETFAVRYAQDATVAPEVEPSGTSCQRVAKLATPTRAYRLKVCTTWLPPGGSCQTALRNRLTDEGRRTVGQEMQLDERYMFQIVPFNREIQNF